MEKIEKNMIEAPTHQNLKTGNSDKAKNVNFPLG
jgi:hypothetical protein